MEQVEVRGQRRRSAWSPKSFDRADQPPQQRRLRRISPPYPDLARCAELGAVIPALLARGALRGPQRLIAAQPAVQPGSRAVVATAWTPRRDRWCGITPSTSSAHGAASQAVVGATIAREFRHQRALGFGPLSLARSDARLRQRDRLASARWFEGWLRGSAHARLRNAAGTMSRHILENILSPPGRTTTGRRRRIVPYGSDVSTAQARPPDGGRQSR